jgi:hypothetical protein
VLSLSNIGKTGFAKAVPILNSVVLFVTISVVLLTMYGGGFATGL